MQNDLTYLLAILVVKEVLTLSEAKVLQVESRKSVTTSSLAEMITKVTKALDSPEDAIKKIDAAQFLTS